MQYAKDSFLNPRSLRVERSIKVLESLGRVNGGYLASPNPGEPDGKGRYNVFWLRDIMYATYANEYLGDFDKMIKSYELVMTIMMKYRHKIRAAIKKKPNEWALHARFHPNTLEELTPDWGHHQLDVFGLFLYKTGDLIKKGHAVIETPQQRQLISDIIQYLFTHRWETQPDFGVWEEGPELHSSSIGAVIAGLTMWHDDGHYHYKYPQHIDLSVIVPVSERYFDNKQILNKMLPNESDSRECDMAQLSLIWPYNIVDDETKKRILTNVENKLVRKYGTIRYENDRYFNSDNENISGNEAQWPLGLCWLSIIHNKMAGWESWKGNLTHAFEHLKRSKEYLEQIDKLMVNDEIPELYSEGKPNENRPLAWAHSFHIVALQSFLNTLEIIRKNYNVDISEELEPIY